MDTNKLYEQIMDEVSQIVQKRLNENNESKFNMDALNDSKNNLKIAQNQPDVYKCKQAPDKSLIGTTIKISEIGKPGDVDITIYGKTFIEMCKKIAVIFNGSIAINLQNMPEHGFNVELNEKFKNVWKKVLAKLNDDDITKIEDYGTALYIQVFHKATSVQDVIAKLKTFKMN